MAQWEHKVQEWNERCDRMEASRGASSSSMEGSVLNQMTGVMEVKKMCEELRTELKDFTAASESRRAQGQGATGLSVQEVGEVCRQMWNQKVQELEDRTPREVAQEFGSYVSRREWSEAMPGYVQWGVFTKETQELRSRCDQIEATVRSWEVEEVDPPSDQATYRTSQEGSRGGESVTP